MISSPCSAEQAQRIKLCPRKSPPQSFPPIAQQAPGHFVRGLAVVGRHSPPPKPQGQGPPRMKSMKKALGQPSGGFPCASSKTRRAAGHTQPQGSSRGQGPPRMRSIQKALGQSSGGFPCASSKARRAAGHAQPQGSSRGQGPPRMRFIQKALEPNRFGGFLHPLFLLLRIQCTLACFCRRLRQSAIMAMNSEFVGLPLMFETV